MAWSIAEVARMSGVTSRTLRHYDEIGLLAPACIGGNGHRYYEDAGLLRLQQILLMRELGLGMRGIAAVLESQVDQVAALRAHQRRLLAERDRLDVLSLRGHPDPITDRVVEATPQQLRVKNTDYGCPGAGIGHLFVLDVPTTGQLNPR